MKILLDECLPRKLKLGFPDQDLKTVPESGWAGKENGELLRLAEKNFDIFITNDKNLVFQQNIKALNISIIILSAKSNRLKDLLPYVDQIQLAIDSITTGEIITIK
jgi:predicted nuclease of predicted toxin-antitoxin system